MTKALHRLHPIAQRTIYSKDKSITLFLTDDMQLLIKPRSAKFPYPLDVTTVHSLFNVLYIHRADIISEASKHNGIEKPGRSKETESKW